MREFGAVGECKLDGCTCVTEGKTVMGYFAAVPRGAASPLPAIRRRTGNEDVDPPLWPDSCANCKFQETIIALVGIGIRNSAPSLHTTKSLKNRHPSAKVFIAANRVCPHRIIVEESIA